MCRTNCTKPVELFFGSCKPPCYASRKFKQSRSYVLHSSHLSGPLEPGNVPQPPHNPTTMISTKVPIKGKTNDETTHLFTSSRQRLQRRGDIQANYLLTAQHLATLIIPMEGGHFTSSRQQLTMDDIQNGVLGPQSQIFVFSPGPFNHWRQLQVDQCLWHRVYEKPSEIEYYRRENGQQNSHRADATRSTSTFTSVAGVAEAKIGCASSVREEMCLNLQ